MGRRDRRHFKVLRASGQPLLPRESRAAEHSSTRRGRRRRGWLRDWRKRGRAHSPGPKTCFGLSAVIRCTAGEAGSSALGGSISHPKSGSRSCSSSNATMRTPASRVLAIPGKGSALGAWVARAFFWVRLRRQSRGGVATRRRCAEGRQLRCSRRPQARSDQPIAPTACRTDDLGVRVL